jgi:hypothetical protein
VEILTADTLLFLIIIIRTLKKENGQMDNKAKICNPFENIDKQTPNDFHYRRTVEFLRQLMNIVTRKVREITAGE